VKVREGKRALILQFDHCILHTDMLYKKTAAERDMQQLTLYMKTSVEKADRWLMVTLTLPRLVDAACPVMHTTL